MAVLAKAREVRRPEFVRLVGDCSRIGTNLKPLRSNLTGKISSSPKRKARLPLGACPETWFVTAGKEEGVAFRVHEFKPVGRGIEHHDTGLP